MGNLREKKKQTNNSLCSVFQSVNMDESRSLAGYAESASSVASNESVHTQGKVTRGTKPVMVPNSDIDGLLECPVCSNSMYPPIQQVSVYSHLNY